MVLISKINRKLKIELLNAIHNKDLKLEFIMGDCTDERLQFFLMNKTICDPLLISRDYENLCKMSVIDDDEDLIGIFIFDKNGLVVSVILDTSEADDSILDDYGLKDFYIKLSLICANPSNRVRGIARLILKTITDYYNENNVGILLYVAKGKENLKAIEFYESINYKLINKSAMISPPKTLSKVSYIVNSPKSTSNKSYKVNSPRSTSNKSYRVNSPKSTSNKSYIINSPKTSETSTVISPRNKKSRKIIDN